MRHYPPRAAEPRTPWSSRNGSTRAWRKVRAYVLARDNYTCRECGDIATVADHINAGGPDHPDNLRALCSRCNLDKGGS